MKLSEEMWEGQWIISARLFSTKLSAKPPQIKVRLFISLQWWSKAEKFQISMQHIDLLGTAKGLGL